MAYLLEKHRGGGHEKYLHKRSAEAVSQGHSSDACIFNMLSKR